MIKSSPNGKDAAVKDAVSDPHPSNEENYDKIPHPGGSNPPSTSDPGTNSYTHTGKAPPHGDGKGSNGKA